MNTPPSRPNVIWVFGDQHRGQATGFAGDPNVRTPSMDRMAAEGVCFRRAISGNPWCTPFRAAILTGRYPNNSCWITPQRLDPALPTVADAFNDAGYDTAYFGKWHLDGYRPNTHEAPRSALHYIPPERRGRFGRWLGYENNNSQYDCYVHGHDASGTEIPHERLRGYETDALSDLLIDDLRQRGAQRQAGRNQPFFAVLSVQPPHDPYVAPREYMDRHTPGEIDLRPNVPDVGDLRDRARRGLAGYYAQIENLDANLGRIRDALVEADLADDTYVMFFADHGDMHGSQGCFFKSVPYEESIRIPLVVSGRRPQIDLRPQPADVPINHVDIPATTLGLCGVAIPDGFEGYDYSHWLRPDSCAPPPGQPNSAFLQHLVRKMYHEGINRPWRGVVTDDGWKYVCLPGQPLAMYDLNADPYEQYNVALNNRFNAERARLQETLAAWIDRTGDEFALPEL